MARPAAAPLLAGLGLLAAAPLRGAEAWRRYGAILDAPYWTQYAGKFCFDYVPTSWEERDETGSEECEAGRDLNKIMIVEDQVDCEDWANNMWTTTYSYNAALQECAGSPPRCILEDEGSPKRDWRMWRKVEMPGVLPLPATVVASGWPPVNSGVAGVVEVEVRGTVKDKESGAEDLKSWPYLHSSPCEGSCLKSQGKLYLMAFSDETHRWQRAAGMWEKLNCEERLKFASHSVVVANWTAGPFSTSKKFSVRQSVRPRFWYFVFVNCGVPVAGELDFSIHATNIRRGFEEEFSVDLFGSLALEALGWSAFSGLAVAAAVAVQHRRKGSRASPLLLVIFGSSVFSALGCGLRAAHHLVYAFNGQGIAVSRILGTLSACVAKAMLSILQFCMAKGWGLFLTPDRLWYRVAIVGGLVAVVALSMGCEVHEHFFNAMSTSYYHYESWPGLLILTCNLCLLGGSWLLTLDTYLRERSQMVRSFYLFVSAAGGIYFAALPVIHIVAGVLRPWVVRKYVERAEVAARFLATLLLQLMLWPSRVDALVASNLKNQQQQELLAPPEGQAREVAMTDLRSAVRREEEEEEFQEASDQAAEAGSAEGSRLAAGA